MHSDSDRDELLQALAAVRTIPDSWKPFMREADLARMCFATGLNALAKANHMQGGYYNQAFFNISIGLERLLKLTFLIDFAFANEGRFPSEDELRKRFSHDLRKLYDEGRAIRARLVAEGETFHFDLVDADLADRIIDVLADFAQSAGRYYNLDYLVGASKLGRDPLEAWATEVAGYLATSYPERRRARDLAFAADADDLIGGWSAVMQQTEDGQHIGSVYDSVMHGRIGEWVQEQATFHCATMIRYLAEILSVLNHRSKPGAVVELPCLWEFFTIFHNDDRYLKGRKTFLL